MIRKLTLCALALSLCAAGFAAESIKVTGGLISGTVEDGVRVYKGIPFAAPPVGELRWAAPEPVRPWSGVRQCAEFSPQCPQEGYPSTSMFARPPSEQSEDCLYLNVWTAAESPTERRPVMVWIHGGGLTRGTGATATYNGTNLTKKGVVLVTINYRLGAFGFLAHPELTKESKHNASGNYGLLDQISALEWVRDNIGEFGGDASRVTIFGESAGSLSVGYLVASPLTRGLIHGAIGESGAAFRPASHLSVERNGQRSAEQIGLDFAKAAGAGSLADLRALSHEQILDVFINKRAEHRFGSRANVDGWFLPREVAEIYAKGEHNDVPVIVGSNALEMTSLRPKNSIPESIEKYHAAVETMYGDSAKEVLKLYPAKSEKDIKDAYFSMLSHRTFTLGMRTWARMTGVGEAKAYLYEFSRVPPIPNSEYFGAYHAAEIAYVFNNLHVSRRNYDKLDFQLADVMSDYWVNFAATGDPNGKGLPKWRPYDEQMEPYMNLGDSPKLGHGLLKEKLDLLESLPNRRQGL